MIETFAEPINLPQLAAAVVAGALFAVAIVAPLVRSRATRARWQRERLESECQSEANQLNRELDDLRARLAAADSERVEQNERLRGAEQEARKLDAELSAARATLQGAAHLQERFDQVNEEVKALRERNAQFETRLEEQGKQRQEEEQLLTEAKKALTQEFEQTANRIFEAKQQQFTHTSKTSLDQVLSPFKQQLGEFHKRVEDIYHKENSQRNQLVGQIAELQKQAQQISNDAVSLANALKGDNKAQGNWGEIILERLLEQSGLEKGREYETQVSLQSVSGKRFQPDVVVHLPDDKDIIIDSKVSLLDYEKYYACESEQEKELALKGHIESLRTHIRNLSLKEYEALEGIRTLDFVFIFLPIEAAYLLAMQEAPSLFREAYDKNIVLVSPSSLMVALRTVETIWRHEKQSKNAEKIAASAGRLYDQFVLVSKSLDDLGGCLDRARDAYDTTWKRLASGRGNLLKRMEDIRKLGAKTSKTLPKAMARELDDEELDDELREETMDVDTSGGTPKQLTSQEAELDD